MTNDFTLANCSIFPEEINLFQLTLDKLSGIILPLELIERILTKENYLRSSFTGLLVLLAKLGPKVLSILTKVLKSTKVVKVGLAGASAVSYSYLFTWEFALVIMLMLFVHESGHVWAMKKRGVKTKGFYFIPLFGGAAVADEAFPDRESEAYIAIMGPIWGLVLSAFVALLYWLTAYPVLAAAASWMALINLINLLPINPLDGGRIFKSIAFSIHSRLGLIFMVIGIVAMGLGAIFLGISLFWILLLVGATELAVEYGNIRRLKMAVEFGEMYHNVYSGMGEILIAQDASLRRETESAKDKDELPVIMVEVELLQQNLAEKSQPMSDQADSVQEVINSQLATLKEDIENARRKLKNGMTPRQLAYSFGGYLTVAAALYYLMVLMNHVPGASLAFEMLKG